ncbi:MAG TPA: hypothetical protein VMM78_14005 [Thermomicrobiales bacterium]|nr:hypothetical protein [Thermomicrobiales bacterium]
MSVHDRSKTYSADHELATLLKAAVESGEQVRVQAGAESFDLTVTPAPAPADLWAGYDAQAAREARHATRGLLAEVDADALIRALKADREQRDSDQSTSSL